MRRLLVNELSVETDDRNPYGVRRAVAVVSGGLDSTTMAYLLASEGWATTILSVDYGQRHRRELDSARAVARLLGVPYKQVDLSGIGPLLSGSALTDPHVEVPDGPYSTDSISQTVVPNRNAIFLAVATGVAIAQGASRVGFGAHAGDQAVYPDCRPRFVEAFTELARVANEGSLSDHFDVFAPFLNQSKSEIVRTGNDLAVPFELTWSCYRGGELHCGRCGTCVERRGAFEAAGVPDPTVYTTGA